jgi:general secretion pathway protein A
VPATIAEPHNTLTAYEKFYRLRTRPFSLTPDLRFVFHSRSHLNVVRQVSGALAHREGLVVVVGEPGTGKTMLCRTMIETFREERTFLCVILDPLLTIDDLLYHILEDFGIVARGSRRHHHTLDTATRHQLVSTLQGFLASLIPLGAQAVIIIDEAQHLAVDVLEQLRLLSNFETDGAKLLQIVLVGPPELDARLAEVDLRPLQQRIARRITPQPLGADELQAYIEHRLAVASSRERPPEPARPAEFLPSALHMVERVSAGIPRVVNIVCDRALEIGAEAGTFTIDAAIVRAAATRLQLPSSGRWRWRTTGQQTAAVAAVVAIAAAGTWWWLARWHVTQSIVVRQASVSSALPGPAAMHDPEPTPINSRSTGTAAQGSARPAAGATAAVPGASPAAAQVGSAALTGASSRSSAVQTYEIVVAAFRTAKRAADVAAEVKEKGLPASDQTDASGSWHQVVVGPYPSKEAAQSAQKTLAIGGFRDTRVVTRTGDAR